jgi:hypothetical protein
MMYAVSSNHPRSKRVVGAISRRYDVLHGLRNCADHWSSVKLSRLSVRCRKQQWTAVCQMM